MTHCVQEPADDEIKLRRRAQRKFSQTAALQPEDSAEQLSSMPMPSRPSTAAQSASASQQRLDSATVSLGTALMQCVGPVRQTISNTLASTRVGSSAVSGPALCVQQSGSLVQQQTSVTDSNGAQEGKVSGPLAGAAVVAEEEGDSAASAQQPSNASTSTGTVRQISGRQSSSLVQVPNSSAASSLEAQAASDLQLADAPEQQGQQESATMQMVQQPGLAPQHAAFQPQASVDSEPRASTSRSSRSKQTQRGESVYAPRDLTVLEQYEADVVRAYATSFLAEVVMQGTMPAAANLAAADQHAKLLAEVRHRNALNKARHLQEVQEERAAWEAHEQNVKR